jgi:D-3-phosphoglycerate dehydrogenase
MRVVVGASSFGDSSASVINYITSKGIELVKNPYKRKMTKDEIIEHLQGADGLLAGLEPLDEEVFSKCPDLKAIARIGIGMDNVDKVAAKKHGILVSNTPEGPTDAVAEMTLTVLLSLCHNLTLANDDVHNGIWKKRLGHSISELTVLVIGYGNIGRKTAGLLKSLGAQILIYDKYNAEVSNCSLEEGIHFADAITIHASGKDEIITHQMISEMRDGVIILNSARGGLINEKAVYDGLKSGKIAGFWGDALWQEPYDGLLKECDNAILTPHICTYTKKCRDSMEMQAVENLMRDLGV